MNRWIKILIIVPVMLMLSQCVYRPFNSGYVDGHVTGYIEGFVYDANDGYLLSNVHVEIHIQEYIPKRPRRLLNVIRTGPVPPNRRPRPYRHTMVFDVYTDNEGFFAYEYPLYDRYSYSLILRAGDYCSRRMRIDNPSGQYLEIALSPH